MPLDQHTVLAILRERLEKNAITAARMQSVSRTTRTAINAKTPSFYDALRRLVDILDQSPGRMMTVKFALKAPHQNRHLTVDVSKMSVSFHLQLPAGSQGLSSQGREDEVAKIMAYKTYTIGPEGPAMFDAHESWVDFAYGYDLKYNEDYTKVTSVKLLADKDKMNELVEYIFKTYIDTTKVPQFAEGMIGNQAIPEYQWMHEPSMSAKLLNILAKASLFTPAKSPAKSPVKASGSASASARSTSTPSKAAAAKPRAATASGRTASTSSKTAAAKPRATRAKSVKP